jgi:hypothetical protein
MGWNDTLPTRKENIDLEDMKDLCNKIIDGKGPEALIRRL